MLVARPIPWSSTCWPSPSLVALMLRPGMCPHSYKLNSNCLFVQHAYTCAAHRFMIDKNHQGIQAWANLAFKESLNPFTNNCNWYKIVEHVTCKAFAKDKCHLDADLRHKIKAVQCKFRQTIGPCCNPHNPTTQHMEELMLRAFLQLLMAQLSDGEHQAINDMAEQDDTNELQQCMRATGWTDLGLIHFTIGLAQYKRAKVNLNQPWLWTGWLA